MEYYTITLGREGPTDCTLILTSSLHNTPREYLIETIGWNIMSKLIWEGGIHKVPRTIYEEDDNYQDLNDLWCNGPLEDFEEESI